MQLVRDSGVPFLEHQNLATDAAPVPDWEAVRLFLEVARRRSFRAAADSLGTSPNVLRRRVSALEHQLKMKLLTRHVDGVRTTAEGDQILHAAQQMEIASFALMRSRKGIIPEFSGEVKLAVTEGLGAFWIAPRLVEFQRAHPGLLIELMCAMQSADVLRLEADVAIQLTKPANPDLKVVKLGRLHSMPFAGKSYAEIYGIPRSIDQMRRHRFVLQLAEQTETRRLFTQLFPDIPWVGFVSMITNTSTAHSWAIAKGAGIGWVPTYIHAIGGRFIPVDVDARFPFEIWLTYHADVGRIPRVRRLIDWIVSSFDPRKFPWFRDEFIHPKDLPASYHGEPLCNLFEGFVHADQVPKLSQRSGRSHYLANNDYASKPVNDGASTPDGSSQNG